MRGGVIQDYPLAVGELRCAAGELRCTRLSAGGVIQDRSSQSVLEAFLTHWIAVYGVPKVPSQDFLLTHTDDDRGTVMAQCTDCSPRHHSAAVATPLLRCAACSVVFAIAASIISEIDLLYLLSNHLFATQLRNSFNSTSQPKGSEYAP